MEVEMPKDYKVFKAAAIQASPVYRDKPVYFDSDASLEKAVQLIGEAGSEGAQLIVFSETWLPGFPYWSLNMTEGNEWADIWAEYLRHSVEVPSKETDALCDAAKRQNAIIAIGINERDRFYEGRMYNSILYISSEGEILGTHRKIVNTINEALYHFRGDGGPNLKVHNSELGRISGLICGEHYQPLLKQNLIVQGAQVNCSLWPGFKGGAGELVKLIPVMTQALCASGGLWSVLSSTYIPKENVPGDFYPNHTFDATFGGSCIINPFGEIVAGPEVDKETIVYGEIDLKLNAMAKSIINLTGNYSRWDILNLNVREKSYQPLIPMEASESDHKDRNASEIERLKLEVKALQDRVDELSSE